MLEDVIKQLDTRGLMVLGVLMGKRYMDILKEEEPKDTVVPKVNSNILLNNSKLIT